MIAWNLFALGLIATLPMGPAGMNVASSCIKQQSFPVKALAGLLAAEVIYLFVAIYLKSFLLADLEFWKITTSIVAGVFIAAYGVITYLKSKEKLVISKTASGFKKSFWITLSNPSILILQLSVVLYVEKYHLLKQVFYVSSFFMGGFVAFIFIISILLFKKRFFYQYASRVEAVSGIFLFLLGGGLLVRSTLIFVQGGVL